MDEFRRRAIFGGLAAGLSSLPLARALASTKPQAIISKIVLEDGRVWIAGMIGESGPHLFIIDTGAPVSLIKEDVAKSLKLSAIGRSNLAGIGGVSDLPWYVAKEFILGNGIRFPNMLFAGIRAKLGRDASGALGAGLLTTHDSDLDFEKGEWRAYVGGRPDRTGFRKLTSRFSDEGRFGSLIFADASVGDYAGEFLLDTGAPGEVSLDSAATSKSDLWRSEQPYAPVQSKGIGRAAIPARLIRMERMKIGPFVYERPLLMLRKPGNVHNKMRSDGIIGLGALSRLHLSTDVKSRTLWAAPNRLALPPNDYPKSGLWVDQAKGAMTIADVGNGSPAKRAGLMPGDRIVGQEFQSFVKLLSGPAGTSLSFEFERAGKRSRAEFTLAEYL